MADLIPQGYQLLVPGDMGIGNTTPSAAVLCALLEEDPEKIVGRGTGIDDEAFSRKRRVVAEAISKYSFDDPIDVLAKVGGAEIGAIAGLFLGGAAERVPVVIDGFISLAGFAVAYHLEPRVKDFVFCGHCSKEKGAALVVEKLGLRPIEDLDLRLGEGTGAALASFVIETALRILTEMATFEGAGVSKGCEVLG
jgi:nicotinate-nucleotide--dimethylbenzimidazole phosphoribosyltransferase